MKTALIIGSTGLVGSQLLHLLLESSIYDKVIVFVKREIAISHPKLIVYNIDFDKPESYQDFVKGDDFFCTIGTTIKKVGSQIAFKKVDFEYPSHFAQMASKNKVNQFLILSSIGANAKSSNFYLKTKGEMEDFLKKTNIKSISVLRPSLLLGNRNEVRLGEKIGALFMTTFSFLFIGKIKKYKPIESKIVAHALFNIAQKENQGFSLYESDRIQEIGANK